jgi:lipoteichoic acid synthase
MKRDRYPNNLIRSLSVRTLIILTLLICFEYVVQLYLHRNILTFLSVYRLLFTCSIAFVLSAIVSISHKHQQAVFIIMVTCLVFIYGSQILYFASFRTYYTVYSLMHAIQLIDFYRELFTLMLREYSVFPLILIPSFMAIVIHQKIARFSFAKRYSGLLLAFGLLMHGLILIVLNQDEALNQQYHYQQQPDQNVVNFGLLTNMRLDLKNNLIESIPFLDTYENPKSQWIRTQTPIVDRIEAVEFNVLSFDWETLMSQTQDQALLNMHQYFSNRSPSNKNHMTGIFEGKNLIVITGEAFSHYAVREDITPTLYMMANQGIVFNNFYNPVWGVSTSDGEYVVFTSLIPKSRVWSMARSSENHMPLTYGRQFQNLDYLSLAFHNHTYTYYQRNRSHPNLGYVYKGVGNGLRLTNQWPPSDLELMEVTVNDFVHQSPFHVYYMTISGHQFYTFTGNMMARKNRDMVKDLPYSTHVQAYLATQVELDKALEYLIKALKEAGVYQDTVIVISSDHYPYGLSMEEIEELAGKSIDSSFELHRSSLIIHVPEFESVLVDRPVSSMDILPTISNLFGLSYDSRLLMGTDVFSDNASLVIFNDRSFIIDEGRYHAPTKTFIPNPNRELSEDLIQAWKEDIDARFYYSTQILDRDYYRLLWSALIQDGGQNQNIIK